MTPHEAIEFVRLHGVAMESAAGSLPSLAQYIAGEEIRGSWWAHPAGKEIFALTRAVRSCPEILVCRLVAGRITFVHARVWPGLVHLAPRFRPGQLARVNEEHLPTGRHRIVEVPFPAWVPASVPAQAAALTLDAALAMLGPAALAASLAG